MHPKLDNYQLSWLELIEKTRQNSGKENLLKAVGKFSEHITIYDLTAGLGRDTVILARHGFKVRAFEKNPVLFALLQKAHQELLASKYQEIAKKITLINQDSLEFLAKHQPGETEIFYIDAMFPERKKSALVKKDMQFLQQLVGDNDNAAELLQAAQPFGKTILKRPKTAPPLSSPHHIVKGSKIIFYIYSKSPY